jgi:prevent-host-death family protein
MGSFPAAVQFKKNGAQMIIELSEAKARLSQLVDMACRGEEVIISKGNLPLVSLVPHKPKEKRKLGPLAGQIRIPEDFLDEDPEIIGLFYGGEHGKTR